MIMGIHFQSVYWIVNGFFRGLFVLGDGGWDFDFIESLLANECWFYVYLLYPC